MPKVSFARHLYRFFPALEGMEISVAARDVGEVIAELEKLSPGLAFYLIDERGQLRVHVNIFVEEELIADRQRLSDRVSPGSHVYVMQALSGG